MAKQLNTVVSLITQSDGCGTEQTSFKGSCDLICSISVAASFKVCNSRPSTSWQVNEDVPFQRALMLSMRTDLLVFGVC